MRLVVFGEHSLGIEYLFRCHREVALPSPHLFPPFSAWHSGKFNIISRLACITAGIELDKDTCIKYSFKLGKDAVSLIADSLDIESPATNP